MQILRDRSVHARSQDIKVPNLEAPRTFPKCGSIRRMRSGLSNTASK